MITINKNIQSEILMTTMEEIVPEDSLFRKIDKYIDFTFIMFRDRNIIKPPAMRVRAEEAIALREK